MNFKFLICNNCENKELDNSFLIFGPKNTPIINKHKNTDFNIKSILSSSDNNHSTNNLEIIEYPYSYNSNNEFPLEPLPLPPEPIIETKKKYNELDDFLGKISPPKLFSEKNKENKENKEDKDKENKDNNNNKENKEINKNEMLKLNIEIKEIKDLEKKEDKNNDKYNNMEINDIKEEEKNNDKINNYKEKKHSKQASSLITNEDNFLNNKELLNNYYSNCNSAKNKIENKNNFLNKKIENINKSINNNIKINNNDIGNVKNSNGTKEDIHSKFFNNIINGIKVDYPKPDTDIIIKKTNDRNAFYKKSTLINKKEALKIIKSENEENKNNGINNKLKKHNTNFTSQNYKNLNINSQKYLNNNYNRTYKIKKDKKIIEKTKSHIKMKSKTKMINQKFSKKDYHIKENSISNGNINPNNHNEYFAVKTEPNNQSRLNNITNNKFRYKSNCYLNDLLKRKINLKKRNTFNNSNYIYKKRSFKANTLELICPLIPSINYSSKLYSNPFTITYGKKNNK